MHFLFAEAIRKQIPRRVQVFSGPFTEFRSYEESPDYELNFALLILPATTCFIVLLLPIVPCV